MVLSDLLLAFGPRLPRDGRAALAPLVLPPDAELQSQLAAVLMDHVFYRAGSPEEPSATGTRVCPLSPPPNLRLRPQGVP